MFNWKACRIYGIDKGDFRLQSNPLAQLQQHAEMWPEYQAMRPRSSGERGFCSMMMITMTIDSPFGR